MAQLIAVDSGQRLRGPKPPGSWLSSLIFFLGIGWWIFRDQTAFITSFFFSMGPFAVLLILAGIVLIAGLRIVNQYQIGVVFRLGRIVATKQPGLCWIVPFISRMVKVDTRTVTLPIPSQKIITKDNVSIDVAAVAYFRILDPVKVLVAIENITSAIDQIAQTTIRRVTGQFMLDEALSETTKINELVKELLDTQTEQWGVQVSIVAIKDIQLPESMQRAMARQAEAERDRRAKVIAAEGEFQAAGKLAETADIMAAHPIALQLRNLQTLAEIAIEKNSTIIFPNTFMSTIGEVQKFMAQENATLPKVH